MNCMFFIRIYCKGCHKKIFPSPQNKNHICADCKEKKIETNRKSRIKKRKETITTEIEEFFNSDNGEFAKNFLETKDISEFLLNTKHYLACFAFLQAKYSYYTTSNYNEAVEIFNRTFPQYQTTPLEVENYINHPNNKTLRKFIIRYITCRKCNKTLPTYCFPEQPETEINLLNIIDYFENPYQKYQPMPLNFQPNTSALRYSKICRSCSSSPEGPFWKTIDYFLDHRLPYNTKKHKEYSKKITLKEFPIAP